MSLKDGDHAWGVLALFLILLEIVVLGFSNGRVTLTGAVISGALLGAIGGAFVWLAMK